MIPASTPIGTIVWLPRFHQEVVARCEIRDSTVAPEVGEIFVVHSPPGPRPLDRIVVKAQGLYLTEREATVQLIQLLKVKSRRVEDQLEGFVEKMEAAESRVRALDAGAPESES